MESDRVRKIKAFEFLCDNRLAVLSTSSLKDRSPQGSLIYYVVDGKFVYFITTSQSRKLANISQDKNIALTVFTEIPPMELQIEGYVESIDDPAKKRHISDLYLENANKNPNTINWPPILKLPHSQGFVFIKVTIRRFKFSDFSKKEGNITEGTPSDW